MRLSQVVAVESGIKSRVESEKTQLYHLVQKGDAFNGFTKKYRPLSEDGERYPDETKLVQLQVEEVLQQLTQRLVELWDNTATKDYGNTIACADVVVGGRTFISNAPTTFLLWLEKQLVDLQTFIGALPVLNPDDTWTRDASSGLYKTPVTSTHKQKKQPRPIVKYDATKEHPAQTELYMEDVLVGYWDAIKQSGAVPAVRKRQLMLRIETLSKAVKMAREEANATSVTQQSIAADIFNYLLAE